MKIKIKKKTFRKLTPKRKLFVKYYPLCKFNGTKAAIKAGFSKKTAASQAERLLRNVDIRKALKKAAKKVTKKFDLKTEDILKELCKIAFSNIGVYLDKNGCIDLKKINIKNSAQIQQVTSDKKSIGGNKKYKIIQHKKQVKLHDKIKALELLGKHKAMWLDKLEVSEKEYNVKLEDD